MTRVRAKVDTTVDIEELIDNLDTPEYLKLLEQIVDGIFWDDDIIAEFILILQKRGVPVSSYMPNDNTEEWEWVREELAYEEYSIVSSGCSE